MRASFPLGFPPNPDRHPNETIHGPSRIREISSSAELLGEIREIVREIAGFVEAGISVQ